MLSQRKWSLTAVVLIAGAALGVLIARDRAGVPGSAERVPPEFGRDLYLEHCGACHGVALEGEADWRLPRGDGTLPAPPHDRTGHTWHHPDRLLEAIVRDGGQAAAPAGFASRMPAFGEVLSDAEIRAVLDHIKASWPADIRARQAALSAAAKE